MPDLGDRDTLKASFDTRINDNSSNAISEADVRDSLKDTVDTLGAEIDGVAAIKAPSFNFDSGTSVADPGEAEFRFNNANASLATILVVNHVDQQGNDLSALVATWSGIVSIVKAEGSSNIGAILSYRLGARTDHTTWSEFAVTFLTGTLAPDAGTEWHFDFSPATEVDNNLTASTTRAPSKTAVNTALADKATVRVNGSLKKGLFTYSGTTNGSGQLIVDLTAQTPAITEATWLGIGSRLDTDLAHAALADGSLAGYAVQFYDNTGGPLGDSVSVTFTIAGQTD